MSVSLAAGQLPATQGTLLAAQPVDTRVSATFMNTSTTLTETVQLSIKLGAGTARNMPQAILGPQESLVVNNLSLDATDVLLGTTSDANTVDYRISVATGAGAFSFSVLDKNGYPKANSASVAPGVSPAINFKNVLDGGDFSINPWQRNIAGLATANVITTPITNTVTYFPDRWFAVGGASSSIQLSKIADTGIVGFSSSCKLQRTAANANLAVINFGQVMETADCVRLQGQSVTLSFWAKAGANFSAASNNVTVAVYSGTGTNDTAANMIAGSWAGSTTPISATQALTTSYVRYSFTGTIPAGATQLGVLFSFTPVGTAGSDDSITFQGIQLELGGAATAFEHRDVEVELSLCQRYTVVFPEAASGVVLGAGLINGTNAQLVSIPLPTPMRTAPTVTLAAGTLKFNIAGVATAVGGGFAASAAHAPTMISVVGTVTATAGQATNLQSTSAAGAGYVMASAEF